MTARPLRAMGVALAALTFLTVPSTAVSAGPGGLDQTFGNGGAVDLPFVGRDLVADPADRSILVVGTDPAGGLRLVRLRSDGSVDRSFGDGTGATGVAAQAEGVTRGGGRIYVAAGTNVYGFTTSGRLDPSFGENGSVTVPSASERQTPGSDDAFVYTPVGTVLVKVEPSGALLVGSSYRYRDTSGRIYGSQTFDAIGVTRFSATGVLDAGFGGGDAIVGFVEYARPTVLDLDSRGRIIVSAATRAVYTDIYVHRLLPNGDRDETWRTAFDNFRADKAVNDVLVEPDDGLIVASGSTDGFATTAPGSVTRLRADGTIDPSFGDRGIAQIPVCSYPGATSLVRRADGAIAASGFSGVSVVRGNGAIDTSFGWGGSAGPVLRDLESQDGFHAIGFRSDTQLVRLSLDDGGATPLSACPTGGYLLAAADGGIFSFGDAHYLGSAGDVVLNSPVVGASRSGGPYRMVTADGTVVRFDSRSRTIESPQGFRYPSPIVGIATRAGGDGYWIAAQDGGVFSFDAAFHGSMGGTKLNQPIVGIAATPTGQGYWLVARDGGIFAFGDASFLGSTGDIRLNQPIVGMASTPTGRGYWLVASDGGVFSFGDAEFHGSTGALRLNQPVVGMLGARSGHGYLLAARDGGIFTFGDTTFLGSTGDILLNQPVTAILPGF